MKVAREISTAFLKYERLLGQAAEAKAAAVEGFLSRTGTYEFWANFFALGSVEEHARAPVRFFRENNLRAKGTHGHGRADGILLGVQASVPMALYPGLYYALRRAPR